MFPRSAEECDRVFAEFAGRGDLEGLVALYEPKGIFVPQGAAPVSGHAAIREALAELVAAKPKLEMNPHTVIPIGDDTAVVYNDWSMTAAAPDGSRVEATGKAIEIVRRQADGSWRYVFDDPAARG